MDSRGKGRQGWVWQIQERFWRCEARDSMIFCCSQSPFDNNSDRMELKGRLSKNANQVRRHIHDQRFRKNRQRLALEQSKGTAQLQQEFEELDYLQFYPKEKRNAIVISLTASIPEPLPPLDVTTISYYRRLNKAVFQTKLNNSSDLDPHLTHESLHILSMLPEKEYPNFKGLTLQFERELKLYLSAKSKDIRTMAVIAAGNRIIGKQDEILALAEEDEGNLWVLFNHVISEKISYQKLLPYILRLNPIAFRAFYQLSNINRHESIAWFFENDDVLIALIQGLESSNEEVRGLTLRILGNVLGEEMDDYARALIKSPFLELIFKFLISSQAIERKDGCWVLANFASSEAGAIAVVRSSRIMQKLQEMLYYETILQIRRELSLIFNYLIGQSERLTIFQFAARKDFLEVMTVYLSQEDIDLSIATLNNIKELLMLGDEFRDQNEVNIVALTVSNMTDLMREISKAQEHQNSEISASASGILEQLGYNQTMQSEI